MSETDNNSSEKEASPWDAWNGTPILVTPDIKLDPKMHKEMLKQIKFLAESGFYCTAEYVPPNHTLVPITVPATATKPKEEKLVKVTLKQGRYVVRLYSQPTVDTLRQERPVRVVTADWATNETVEITPGVTTRYGVEDFFRNVVPSADADIHGEGESLEEAFSNAVEIWSWRQQVGQKQKMGAAATGVSQDLVLAA